MNIDWSSYTDNQVVARLKPFVIGIVARLVEEKGYLDLFEAFRLVKEADFRGTKLLVVGKSDIEKKDTIDQDIVKNYGIEDDVVFAGEIMPDKMPETYACMDIFVLPSYREGLPNCVLEACAMELPVIATDIRGCREIVDKDIGILVPPHNPQELAKAIIYLLENEDIAKKMGKKGRKKVEKEYNEKDVFKRLNGEYKKLIKEKLCHQKNR